MIKKNWQTDLNISLNYFLHQPQVLFCRLSPCNRATSLSLTAEQTETWNCCFCLVIQSPHPLSWWGSTSQGSWPGPPTGADPAPVCLQSQFSATVRQHFFCEGFPFALFPTGVTLANHVPPYNPALTSSFKPINSTSFTTSRHLLNSSSPACRYINCPYSPVQTIPGFKSRTSNIPSLWCTHTLSSPCQLLLKTSSTLKSLHTSTLF